mgnify:CR=1 FL=1
MSKNADPVRHMDRWKYFALIFVLVGSLSDYSVFFRGTIFPTVFVLGSCFLFVTLYLVIDDRTLHIPRYLLVPLTTLLCAYAITMPFRPEVFYRSIIDITVLSVSVLLIPQVIDRSLFFYFVQNLSVLLVLIGLPAVIIGPYSLFGTTIGYPWQASLPILPGTWYPLQSIYTNPNFLSAFILGGMLTALYSYDKLDNSYSLFACLVSGGGLLLTQSRSAIFIGAFAIFGYIFYKMWGPQIFPPVVIGSILLGVGGFFLLVFGVGPLSQVSLSGRREIWQASILVLIEKPLIGYGPVPLGPIIETKLGSSKPPHSSYIRMFLETGIVGGVSYIWTISTILYQHIRLPIDGESAICFLLGLSLATIMVFETFTLSGIGSSSILASITFGYLIDDFNSYALAGD